MSNFKVSIIIVNWNGFQDTKECLESLKLLIYKNFDIIVVDNGSTDNSVENLKKNFSNIILLEAGKNLGFAGGNNFGIKYALEHGADYVLLLNNDTVVDKHLLNHLISTSIGLGRDSILGAKIYYHKEPKRIWYAGARWVKSKSGFIHEGQNIIDDGTIFNSIRETEYICGCVLFVSANVLKKVGLLDDLYFLTFEETDFCFRARKMGIYCYLVPDAKVWHKVSISFGGENSSLFQYYAMRNKLLWAEKHLSLCLKISLYRDVFHKLLLYLKRKYIDKYLKFDFSRDLKSQHGENIVEAMDNGKKQSDSKEIARILGLRDYLLRRFGECSEKVRSQI